MEEMTTFISETNGLGKEKMIMLKRNIVTWTDYANPKFIETIKLEEV